MDNNEILNNYEPASYFDARTKKFVDKRDGLRFTFKFFKHFPTLFKHFFAKLLDFYSIL